MNISVCVDALFNGVDFVQSMENIEKTGITTIEFWSWWDKDISKIKKVKEKLGMKIIGLCTRYVSLVDISKRVEYIKGLKESIEVAKEVGCKTLISQVGNEMKEESREEQHKNLVEGLKECAPILEGEGITLVIEPLNTEIDHIGYYLDSSNEAFAIIDEVGSPNVKVLFDIYHQHIMKDNLIETIVGNIEKIGHFHAAGYPGRHEITIGEINYKEILNAIDASGYKGFVGLEYFPLSSAEEGLKNLASIIKK